MRVQHVARLAARRGGYCGQRWARHGDRPRAVRESARSGVFIGVALVIASIALTVSGRTSVMLVFVGLSLRQTLERN